MIKRLLLIGIFILVTACSPEEAAIVKQDTMSDNPNDDPELIEETNGQEKDEFIEFSLPNEQVRVNLKMVPILKNYLHAVKDPQTVIEDMKITRIDDTKSKLYMLEFSCHNDLCSYLLLDRTKDNKAHLVADLAKINQVNTSPDDSKLLLQFDREVSLPIPLTNIVVIDLEEWEPMILNNDTDGTDILNYEWPIIEAAWYDNNTISVSKPAVAEPTSELINQWQEIGENTTTILLSTENTD